MEDKLKVLVEKIESSKKLPDPVKDKIYQILESGLRTIVWPVLLQYIPDDQLVVTGNPDNLTVDGYIKLIEQALSVNDGEALKKIEETMNLLIDDVDAALAKEV